MQQLKRRRRDALVAFVIGDHRPEMIRSKDFGGLKVFPSKRGLTAAGRTDQHNQRQFGERDVHNNLCNKTKKNEPQRKGKEKKFRQD